MSYIEPTNDAIPSLDEMFSESPLFSELSDSENDSNFNLTPAVESEISPKEIIKDKFKAILGGNKSGFYITDSCGDQAISNFVILFDKWIKTTRNGEILSFYSGNILMENNTIPFDRLLASSLSDTGSLLKFIENMCGPRALIYGKVKDLALAVRKINQDVNQYNEQEFGYSEDLKSYITQDLVITATDFKSQQTPIKYSDSWGNCKLGFNFICKSQADLLKKSVVEKLLRWDDPKIMYNALAFTVYPLIYPFLKERNPNKFFLMLKGPSGSGKSQMSKWFQNFYGHFPTLLSWSSTGTSINILGSAFKDALFAVDDLKIQNFRTESDAKTVMITLQNYSDGTSRQRANVDLSLKDQRVINGHLLISAEDLVISESSTIARGVVLNVESKDVKLDELYAINNFSKDFSGIMPYLIQYILKNMSVEFVELIFDRAYKSILEHPSINNSDIPKDNLPRILNNFAALKTSWKIISNFFFGDLPGAEKAEYNDIFNRNLISILLENIERISSYKQEVIFERCLWEMIENGTFLLQKVWPNGTFDIPSVKGKPIGYYQIMNEENVKIILQLPTIIREMRGRVENFAISEDTLKTKLLNERKIQINPSGKFSIGGNKVNGVSWIGQFPKSLFGLKEPFNPVEEASNIIFNSEQIEEKVIFN